MKKSNKWCGVVAVASLFLCSACSSTPPETLGVKGGELAMCPDSPNCVSSQAKDPAHFIAPFSVPEPVWGDTAKVMTLLQQSLEQLEGVSVVRVEGAYLHAEGTSKLMRFVDDVECLYVPEEQRVHIRSAARLGYKDFSVNRDRAERLRKVFQKALDQEGLE